VSQTVNGVTTNYVLDSASPLTQVLQDGTNTYIYGVDRIAQVNGAAPEYFLTDGLGSVRQLVDGAGNITLAKSYQPYGTEMSSVGSGASSYGFTGEMTDPTGLIYLRARYLAPNDGRFLTKDTWEGVSTSPISYNKWVYANSNPLYYTDASGNFPIPLILLLLSLGIITFGTSGCSTEPGPEPDACPPLSDDNLQPHALRVNPPEQSLQNIKNSFGIQLPPPVTYIDQNGVSHTTSYDFVFSEKNTVSSYFQAGGYTPWFIDNSSYGTWGDVVIFRTTFQRFGNSAYDIASVMVHEAMHAWQQYTLVQLAQDPESAFAKDIRNETYYTKEWQNTYGAMMEYEASSYTLSHMPNPLCTREEMRKVEQANKDAFGREMTSIPGVVGQWQMAGYPLP
jgi:RHS repeat-associated protein